MKKAGTSKKTIPEPTLGEVLSVMNERFTLVESRIDQRFGTMVDRMDNADARLSDVQRRLGKVEMRVEDIQDDLTAALHSVDNDGETIINHERRIAHLEKLGGIENVPPSHLASI